MKGAGYGRKGAEGVGGGEWFGMGKWGDGGLGWFGAGRDVTGRAVDAPIGKPTMC